MAAVVILGGLTALLVIVQAFAITNIVVPAFLNGASLHDLRPWIITLACVLALRVLASYLSDAMAFRASAAAKSELRISVMRHIGRLGPVWLSRRNSGELTQVVTRGIDGLDGYFARYLPQLVLAVIVPLSVGIVILTQDILAAVVVAATIPLIPVFMILIGKYTQGQVEQQWATLGRLSGHFVDVVAGMSTLKAFGRASAQAENVRRVGDRYRVSTMGVLRISFLSALVLELLATLSVAVIAVSIGLRLVDGSMNLHTGLLVLILAPEVYLPLRQVGVHFHAAAEGLGAAGDMVEILEQAPPISGPRTDIPNLATATLRLDHLTVAYENREDPAVNGLSLTISPGQVTALIGPSGCGKSTVLAVLERFLDPSSGQVSIESAHTSVELRELDIQAWRSQVAWVGQEPHLISASVADNVRIAKPDANADQVWAALAAVQLDRLVAQLPDGIDTPLGEGGAVLSVGQTRRVALARAFCQDASLVLLDEPTAALDIETEESVLTAIAALAVDRTVILVAHRQTLIDFADEVIELPAPVDAERVEASVGSNS